MYQYRATVLRVIDGDTVHVDLDLGCDVHQRMTLRLFGINAPEMRTPEGPAARDHLIRLLGLVEGLGFPVVVVDTIKDRREKYGRYLAVLSTIDGLNVNERMILDGHAVPYHP
jgi:micrococcal nuclease